MGTPARGAIGEVVESRGVISPDDLYLFHQGTHYRIHRHLGARPHTQDGVEGVHFAVWAPNASGVSVVGDFNAWERGRHPLSRVGGSGVWGGFIPGLGEGVLYKFFIKGAGGYEVAKADPVGFMHESAPNTASIVRELEYAWNDQAWMKTRGGRQRLDKPWSIYEVHLGSWFRAAGREGEWPLYREIGPRLAEHVTRLGFTHVEFLPVMEHPLYRSWGYQTTGFFAPSSRFGTPQEFMGLVDCLHQAGIGVILDWVPSHFPSDEHGLVYFDGTHLFEHEDPRQGFHPEWTSCIFNYGRHEVRSFLISNAMHWLETYHADALRVDAVASMIYLDYARKPGEWIPNAFGGRENLEAVEFLRALNAEVYRSFPDAHTIAEESTAWPLVTRPTHVGGLGFGFKWDMGWMHDTLEYLALDPVHRKHHHRQLTFRSMYQFAENYVLPLSHDEVVHGKGSLIRKMAGDEWQKFANLRLLLANQWMQPGKKLLFMGCEIAQWNEWYQEVGLDWHLLEQPLHAGVERLVKRLNEIYRDEAALHEMDCEPAGFEWISPDDADQSVMAFVRFSRGWKRSAVAVFNYTPVVRHACRVGLPGGGVWREILNTDASEYGGSGVGNLGRAQATPTPCHGRAWSAELTLPPLSALVLIPEEASAAKTPAGAKVARG
ncbi:MAG: 1,4-alpha-glucan branching protein GlgB [Phycisphaerales bacterium]|nr:1,4-alpha-glucan branching protein GlgB [Phycisphaerales bacterium]